MLETCRWRWSLWLGCWGLIAGLSISGAEGGTNPGESLAGQRVYPYADGVELRVGDRVVGDTKDLRYPLRVEVEQGRWARVPSRLGPVWIAICELIPAERAVTYFTRSLGREPNDPHALFFRGMEWLERDNASRAEADLNRLLELRPKHAAGWCLRAQVARAMNRPQQALADFTEAVRLAPNDPLLWRHRAEFRRKRLGQITGAVEDATRAIELDPEWALARYERGEGHRLLGDWERAIEDDTLALCLNPEKGRYWRARGNVWLESGHPERALSDYSQALKRDETVAGTWVARGHAHSQLGQVREALEDFAKALQLEPGLAAAHNGRGLLLLQTVGDPQQALVEFHEALWLDAETPWVRANRALGFAHLGERERAWTDIRRAEREAPDQPWVKIVKSLLLSGWAEGDAGAATEAAGLAWEGLAAGVGPQGEAWGALAAAMAAGGDYRGAVDCQRRALWESQPGRQAEMARRMMSFLTHRPYRFPNKPLDHEWRSPSEETPLETVRSN